MDMTYGTLKEQLMQGIEDPIMTASISGMLDVYDKMGLTPREALDKYAAMVESIGSKT